MRHSKQPFRVSFCFIFNINKALRERYYGIIKVATKALQDNEPKGSGSGCSATLREVRSLRSIKSMEINQKNKHGDNKISFSVGGDFTEIKSFRNSQQIIRYYKESKVTKTIAITFSILNFLLSPIYGYFIIKWFFKQ